MPRPRRQPARRRSWSGSSWPGSAPSEAAGGLGPERLRAAAGGDGGDGGGFKALGLNDWLGGNLARLGIVSPTAVQAACVPQVLAGRDVIGTAQTGSGKTAAFALPILQARTRRSISPSAPRGARCPMACVGTLRLVECASAGS